MHSSTKSERCKAKEALQAPPRSNDDARTGGACAALLVTLFAAVSEGSAAAIFAFETDDRVLAFWAFHGAFAVLSSVLIPALFGIALLFTREPARQLGAGLVRAVTGTSDKVGTALLLIVLVFSGAAAVSASAGSILARTMTVPFAALGEALVLIASTAILLFVAAPVGHAAAALVKRRTAEWKGWGIFGVLLGISVVAGFAAFLRLPSAFASTLTAALLGLALSTFPTLTGPLRRFLAIRSGRLIIAVWFAASVSVLFFFDTFPTPTRRVLQQDVPATSVLIHIGNSLGSGHPSKKTE